MLAGVVYARQFTKHVVCTGAGKGPVITVAEAEAAVSKAREACQASQQAALQGCNADWIATSGDACAQQPTISMAAPGSIVAWTGLVPYVCEHPYCPFR